MFTHATKKFSTNTYTYTPYTYTPRLTAIAPNTLGDDPAVTKSEFGAVLLDLFSCVDWFQGCQGYLAWISARGAVRGLMPGVSCVD